MKPPALSRAVVGEHTVSGFHQQTFFAFADGWFGWTPARRSLGSRRWKDGYWRANRIDWRIGIVTLPAELDREEGSFRYPWHACRTLGRRVQLRCPKGRM